jgi:hypothetical protein
MVALVAVLAFAAGILVGAFAAARWLRPAPLIETALPVATAAGELVAAPAQPALTAPAEAAAEAPPDEPDSDLKPVFEATRGVVSELEQRYQGSRAPGSEEQRKTQRPRRRQGRSR